MRFYTEQHSFYCGIDLHSKTMYLCILDSSGKKLLHRNIKNDAAYFLKLIEPYRENLVVCVECVYSWYWLADLCEEEKISFVLGHALYMRAIHGGKAKNDKIDSEKIATLLRGGLIPQSYVYPKRMRAARDLMRRRTSFVRHRAELLTHIHLTNHQYNLSPLEGSIGRARHRKDLENHFSEEMVKLNMSANLGVISKLDEVIKKLELELIRKAEYHDSNSFRILQTIPGVGPILSMTILYEIDTIKRFPRVQEFLSYSRLVKCSKESAGKKKGTSGSKIGNAYLKWAFSEAAILFMAKNEDGKKRVQKLEKKHGKGKAISILASKLGRTAYHLLNKEESFDEMKFFNRKR